jgi:hypothetical protein
MAQANLTLTLTQTARRDLYLLDENVNSLS